MNRPTFAQTEALEPARSKIALGYLFAGVRQECAEASTGGVIYEVLVRLASCTTPATTRIDRIRIAPEMA